MVKGKFWYAHRYAWTMARGPIPDRVQVLQICGVRNCINVEHLQLALPERHIRQRENGCWEWTAGNRGGYGRVAIHGKLMEAHRWMWERTNGPIPEGLELDHLCRNRACVNPEHLEPVSHLENIRRGETGAHNARKTHCKHGHPLSGANLHIKPDGERRCRTCSREEMRRARALKRL